MGKLQVWKILQISGVASGLSFGQRRKVIRGRHRAEVVVVENPAGRMAADDPLEVRRDPLCRPPDIPRLLGRYHIDDFTPIAAALEQMRPRHDNRDLPLGREERRSRRSRHRHTEKADPNPAVLRRDLLVNEQPEGTSIADARHQRLECTGRGDDFLPDRTPHLQKPPRHQPGADFLRNGHHQMPLEESEVRQILPEPDVTGNCHDRTILTHEFQSVLPQEPDLCATLFRPYTGPKDVDDRPRHAAIGPSDDLPLRRGRIVRRTIRVEQENRLQIRPLPAQDAQVLQRTPLAAPVEDVHQRRDEIAEREKSARRQP